VKFRYIILHSENGTLTGTDQELIAQAFCNDEVHVVIDTELGTFHHAGHNGSVAPHDLEMA